MGPHAAHRRTSAAACLALLLSWAAVSPLRAEEATITIQGQDITATSRSVKCDTAMPDWVSVRRLVHCDSATLLEFGQAPERDWLLRFAIDPSDAKISSGIRAELRDLHEALNGEEMWYRFATLLPQNFPLHAPHRLVLAQWHERMRGAGPSLRPPISHRLWDGRFVVTLWNNERIAAFGPEGDGEILFEIPRIEADVFYDFVYRVRWSDGEDGGITAWLRTCPVPQVTCDGGAPWREIIRYEGSTGYPGDVVQGYYFKIGLYTVHDFDVPFTAYHKNYRRGANPAEVGVDDAIFQ